MWIKKPARHRMIRKYSRPHLWWLRLQGIGVMSGEEVCGHHNWGAPGIK